MPDSPAEDDAPSADAINGPATSSATARTLEISGNSNVKMPTVKLRTFAGTRKVGEYREWKREIEMTQALYDLTDEQMSPLVYLALEPGVGNARQLLDDMDVKDLRLPGSLKEIWRRMDQEYDQKDYELTEEVMNNYEKIRRAPGQNMMDYLSEMTHARRQVERLDPGTSVSDLTFAHRVLRRSGLKKEEKRQVLAACGASWDANKILSALRLMYGDAHQDDKSRGHGHGERRHGGFRHFATPSNASSSSFNRGASGRFGKGKGKGKYRYSAYAVDNEENFEDDEEEENLEEDEGEDDQEEDELGAEETDEEAVMDAFFQAYRRSREKGKGKSRSSAPPDKSDARKKNSTCTDCLKKGHWKGDAECEKVKSGETPLYVKKLRDGPRDTHVVDVPHPVHPHEATEFSGMTNFHGFTQRAPHEKPPGSEERAHPHDVFTIGVVKREHPDRPPTPPTPPSRPAADNRGVYMLLDDDQLEAMLESRRVKKSGTREQKIDRLLRSDLHGGMLVEPPKKEDSKDEKRESTSRGRTATSTPGTTGSASTQATGGAMPRRASGYGGKTPEVDPREELIERVVGLAGLRRRLTEKELESLKPLTVKQLSSILCRLKQPFSGNKAALLERINEYFIDLQDGPYCRHIQKDGRSALKWSSSKEWSWATCSLCGRRVEQVATKERKDVLALDMDTHDVLWNDIDPGSMILDTVCRRTVAGRQWLKKFLALLRQRGLKAQPREIDDEFRYGDGTIVRGTVAWTCPVGIMGFNGFLDIAEVPVATPPLMSRRAMRDLRIALDFDNETIDVRTAGVEKQPMRLSAGEHVLLNLLDFGELVNVPEKYLVDENDHIGLEDYTGTKDHIGSEHFTGVPDTNPSKLNDVVDLTDGDDEHEDMKDPQLDDYENEYYPEKKNKVLKKGARKRLKRNLKDVSAVINLKKEKETNAFQEPPTTTFPKATTRKWKVLEIFTWTMTLSTMAATMGWSALPSISIETGFDLRTKAGQKAAWEIIYEEKPDVIVCAFPCKPWSAVRKLGLGRPGAKEDLREEQDEDRPLLVFTNDVAEYQVNNEKHFVCENPRNSDAYKQPEMSYVTQNLYPVDLDMCRYGLRHPKSKLLCKKPTRLYTSSRAVAEKVSKKCGYNHMHGQIAGSGTMVYKNKKMYVSAYLGGYTAKFCYTVLKALECEMQLACDTLPVEAKRRRLREKTPQERTVYGKAQVARARALPYERERRGRGDAAASSAAADNHNHNHYNHDADANHDHNNHDPDRTAEYVDGYIEDDDPEKLAQTEPELNSIPNEVKKAVRRMHRSFGHCSREALLRCLRRAGAEEPYIQYAKKFHCEICEARKAPGRVRVAALTERPKQFNDTVGVDTKTIVDGSATHYYVLNIVDYATRFSMMCHLENESSAEAARAYKENWVSWAGVSSKIVADQGTEFRKDFAKTMAQLGIRLRVTPTEAPWQHSLTERNGQVSGEVFRATVEQMSVNGTAEVKEALIATNIAKNRRVGRDGYSARQRVFGVGERLPGSVIDGMEDDALGELGEVDDDPIYQRALKIRSAAMKALEEVDASDRIRRALLSDGRPTPGPFLPGATVFFWRTSRTRTNLKGRASRLPERWIGPAVVIGQEMNERGEGSEGYWLVHNGNLLLVAPQHLRNATAEERLTDEVVQHMMNEYGNVLDATGEQRHYEDLRGPSVEISPPRVPPEESPAAPQTPRLRPVTATWSVTGSPEPECQPSPERRMPGQEEVVQQPGQIPDPLTVAAETPLPEDDDLDLMDNHMDVDGGPHGSLVLEYKPGRTGVAGTRGRELDPKKFNRKEHVEFKEAAHSNWKKHLELDAVSIVYPPDIAKVNRRRVLPVPSRFVYTVKDGKPSARWVVPGHTDPDKGLSQDDGGVRTDAPVAPQIALHIALLVTVIQRWVIGAFDIGSAFLTGDAAVRLLYALPPRCGLPDVPDGSLILLKKGVFGLPEAPRLWWEKFSRVLQEAGFIPVPSVKGFYVLRDKDGLHGILVVHVDDGLWGGRGAVFEKAKDYVRKHLNVKKEHQKEFTFLGKRIRQDDAGNVLVDQPLYIKEIEPIYLPAHRRRDSQADATTEEVTKYKSLTQQLAWPARSSMPELCFDVSDLQQRAENLKIEQIARANMVLRNAKSLAEEHVMSYKVGVVNDVSELTVLGISDASFAGQPKEGSQTGYIILATSAKDYRSRKGCGLMIDWGSHRVRRVVKSTLASEAAGSSQAYDRAVFARYLLSHIFYGDMSDWVKQVNRIPAAQMTDCKSLVDLTQKEGSLPTEKRIALDIRDLQDGIEQGVNMVWTSTDKMICDGLTKKLPVNHEAMIALAKFVRIGECNLVPTPKLKKASQS